MECLANAVTRNTGRARAIRTTAVLISTRKIAGSTAIRVATRLSLDMNTNEQAPSKDTYTPVVWMDTRRTVTWMTMHMAVAAEAEAVVAVAVAVAVAEEATAIRPTAKATPI